ncbi:hypothetical protein [Pseudocitrobacter vendiensis]|uniref:Uncharacterized protein n=1 Tax=Pseudocitrobacter vendiensis TaxID=2488306 RepID=A0ABM9F9K7_9ENTR|nr:hypothetical protein [Pseudocitrobacter vendiensis]CAH6659846.1 hypothetical protein FBBNIHIM_12025 [Pseudocitrobacter vendiensis]
MDLRDAGWHDIGDVRFQLTIPGGSLVSLQASLSIWVNESGKLLLYLSNSKVLYFVVISIFLGVALAISGIKISTNKLYHRLFQQNESCKNGYALFLADIGMGGGKQNVLWVCCLVRGKFCCFVRAP